MRPANIFSPGAFHRETAEGRSRAPSLPARHLIFGLHSLKPGGGRQLMSAVTFSFISATAAFNHSWLGDGAFIQLPPEWRQCSARLPERTLQQLLLLIPGRVDKSSHQLVSRSQRSLFASCNTRPTVMFRFVPTFYFYFPHLFYFYWPQRRAHRCICTHRAASRCPPQSAFWPFQSAECNLPLK